ncbi:hypothetical protein [Kitasatospora sp. NPDC087315]|uniref:hypothetical protein n=1 Tax=Kitasatospora sp. NPDC087315 TaxID=3364069 RepID=UPI00382B3A28
MPLPRDPDQPSSVRRTTKPHRDIRPNVTAGRSVYLDAEIKQLAQQKVEADDDGLSLADHIRKGWDKFMAGELVMRPARRAQRGTGASKARLVQWESDEYWEALVTKCDLIKEQVGFKINPSTVAEQYLRENYLGLADEDEDAG